MAGVYDRLCKLGYRLIGYNELKPPSASEAVFSCPKGGGNMLSILILLYVLSANGWMIPTGAWVAAWTLAIASTVARVFVGVVDNLKK